LIFFPEIENKFFAARALLTDNGKHSLLLKDIILTINIIRIIIEIVDSSQPFFDMENRGYRI
jgi:hypothetical protein